MFFSLIQEPFIVLGLSIRDLWHERFYSFTVMLVITLLLLPAFVLFAVRRATVEAYTQYIKNDPKSLQVITQAAEFDFDAPTIQKIREWKDADGQPLVQSIIEYTNTWVSKVAIRRPGSDKIIDVDLIPSEASDPFIWSQEERANPDFQSGTNWVVLTQPAAIQLGVPLGQPLEMGISNPPQPFENTVTLKVAKILEPSISDEVEIYVSAKLTRQITHWWDGYAVGEHRWANTKRGAKGQVDGLLAATSGQVPEKFNLRRLRSNQPFEFRALTRQDLQARFGIVNQAESQVRFHEVRLGSPIPLDQAKEVQQEFDLHLGGDVVWSSVYADLSSAKIKGTLEGSIQWIGLNLTSKPEANFGFLFSPGQRFPEPPPDSDPQSLLFGTELQFGAVTEALASPSPSQSPKQQIIALKVIADNVDLNGDSAAQIHLIRGKSQVQLQSPVDELKPEQDVKVFMEFWIPAAQVNAEGVVQPDSPSGASIRGDIRAPESDAEIGFLQIDPSSKVAVLKPQGDRVLAIVRSSLRFDPAQFEPILAAAPETTPPTAPPQRRFPVATKLSSRNARLSLEGIPTVDLPLPLADGTKGRPPRLGALSVDQAARIRALVAGQAEYVPEFGLIQDKPPGSAQRLRIYASSIESVIPLVDQLGEQLHVQSTSRYKQIQQIAVTDKAIREVSLILLVVVGVAGGLAILFGIMVNVEKRLPNLSLLRLIGLGAVGLIPLVQATLLALLGYGSALGLYYIGRGYIANLLQLDKLFQVDSDFIRSMATVSKVELCEVAGGLFAVSTLGAIVGVVRVYASAKPADGFRRH